MDTVHNLPAALMFNPSETPPFGATRFSDACPMTRARRGSASPRVAQEFPVEGDDDSIALWGFVFREVHRQIDRAHDSVSEFFVDQFLEGMYR
jgi:hypothetical protein